MSNKKLALLVLGLMAVVLLTSAACVSKKTHEAKMAEQKAIIDQAQNRIAELEKANEALNKGLADAKAALAAAQSENAQLKSEAGSLKSQISALESQKADLDKALAAGKITEENYKKKVGNLNWKIGQLNKDLKDKEAAIAAKDTEIARLQSSEASLKAAGEEQAKKISALQKEKADLQALMDKTVAGKMTIIYVLAVLFVIALIAAIVGFRKRGAAAA